MITMLEVTHTIQMNPRELDTIYMALELLRDSDNTENGVYQEAKAILEVLGQTK